MCVGECVRGLKVLVYEALSCQCMRPKPTSVGEEVKCRSAHVCGRLCLCVGVFSIQRRHSFFASIASIHSETAHVVCVGKSFDLQAQIKNLKTTKQTLKMRLIYMYTYVYICICMYMYVCMYVCI
jgi:hypothetical protein